LPPPMIAIFSVVIVAKPLINFGKVSVIS
jgi:hypothetical protein